MSEVQALHREEDGLRSSESEGTGDGELSDVGVQMQSEDL